MLDAALDAFMRKALVRDAGERFASAEEMRAALMESGEVTVVAPVKQAPVASSDRRLVGLAVVAVVVGVGAWALSRSPAPVTAAGDAAVQSAPSASTPERVAVVEAAAPVASESAATMPDASRPAAALREAGAAPVKSMLVEVSASGVELDPNGRRALGSALAARLQKPAFDAPANGFGRLVAHAAPSGEISDARYLGFDGARPSPAFEPAFERRSRVAFDDLGQCLRSAAAVGRRVAKPSTEEDREIVVTFSP